MKVWHSAADVPADIRSVVTVGNFDGVHRGHQIIAARTVELARSLGATAAVVTFDPHPARVHRPHVAPPLLTGLTDRMELLERLGIEATLVIEYDLDFAQLTPREFVDQVLVQTLGAVAVVIGQDARFGRDNVGTISTMADLGNELGFIVEQVDDVASPGMARRWSSTWVRDLLEDGDVATAAAVLGRPHRMRGEVVHGFKRGRELGFPTANLSPDADGLIPRDGVYAGWLTRRWGTSKDERLPAAISIGTNPTFSGVIRTVEAHVLGRDDLDLYGETVVLEFVRRLRPTVKFTGIEPLIEQMQADVINAAVALEVEIAR